MPKKRDGTETKKSRKSSAASKDNISSPMTTSDILPPPTPSATHLVASNPFDDSVPPAKMMSNFGSQPMMRIGGGMGPGYPGWSPGLRGMRPYGGSGAPGWNASMHSQNLPNYNPNNGFGHFPGQVMPFQGSPRLSINTVRSGIGPFGPPDDSMMHEPTMGPNHLVSSGNQGHMLQNTGQMKVLTRPAMQMPITYRKGSSSNKGLVSDHKSPKSFDGAGGKQRKKSDKKLANENKIKNNDNDKSNAGSEIVPPHSIPPKERQHCKQCTKVIDYPTEDAIRCLASCNSWYHRTCVGVTPEALNCLKNEEFALWACDLCLHTKEIQSVFTRPQLVDGAGA